MFLLLFLHSPLFFNLVDFPLHNLYGKKHHDCYSFQKKNFKYFLFHLKTALFKPFHYLYGIFIPKCYSYFEISPDFFNSYFPFKQYSQQSQKTPVADTFLQQEFFNNSIYYISVFRTTRNIAIIN